MLKKSFVEVFRQPIYSISALSIALIFFLASIWLARYKLLNYIFGAEIFDWQMKVKTIWFLISGLNNTFTPSSIVLVISLSILSAINITMMVFYIKRRIILQKRTGVGIFGMIVGFFGVGCASCGSLVLSTIFGLSATASFIGILPFKGLEFGFLGIILLLVSIYLIAQKIQNPLLCKIDH